MRPRITFPLKPVALGSHWASRHIHLVAAIYSWVSHPRVAIDDHGANYREQVATIVVRLKKSVACQVPTSTGRGHPDAPERDSLPPSASSGPTATRSGTRTWPACRRSSAATSASTGPTASSCLTSPPVPSGSSATPTPPAKTTTDAGADQVGPKVATGWREGLPPVTWPGG